MRTSWSILPSEACVKSIGKSAGRVRPQAYNVWKISILFAWELWSKLTKFNLGDSKMRSPKRGAANLVQEQVLIDKFSQFAACVTCFHGAIGSPPHDPPVGKPPELSSVLLVSLLVNLLFAKEWWPVSGNKQKISPVWFRLLVCCGCMRSIRACDLRIRQCEILARQSLHSHP